MLKFFSALAVLLLALFLQLFFASANWHFNLALAALIAFASVFEFWELLVLDLLAVFILNWKPAPSLTLIIFAFIPLAAFVFRKFIDSERWIGSIIAIVAGLFVFYLLSAPGQLLPNFPQFLEDLIVCLAAAELILFVFAV